MVDYYIFRNYILFIIKTVYLRDLVFYVSGDELVFLVSILLVRSDFDFVFDMTFLLMIVRLISLISLLGESGFYLLMGDKDFMEEIWVKDVDIDVVRYDISFLKLDKRGILIIFVLE